MHQEYSTTQAPIVKVATFGLVMQKTVQILYLFLMMSDGGRHEFEDLLKQYPETREGDKEYTGHTFSVILQYLGGISLLMVAFCLVRKNSMAAPYLVPWLCTISQLSELPMRPVLPEYMPFLLILIVFGQILVILFATGCHFLVVGANIVLAGSYIAYYAYLQYDLKLQLGCTPIILLFIVQCVYVAFKLSGLSRAQVAKLQNIKFERDGFK